MNNKQDDKYTVKTVNHPANVSGENFKCLLKLQ